MLQKEVEIAKEEWELGRLQALKEEEELRAAIEEDEMLFTYAQDEGANQVKKKGKNKTSKKSVSPQNRNKVVAKRKQSGDGDWAPDKPKPERKTPRTPPKTSTPARTSSRKIIPPKKLIESTNKSEIKRATARSVVTKKSPKTPSNAPNMSRPSSRTRANSSLDSSFEDDSLNVTKSHNSTPNESPIVNFKKKPVVNKPVKSTTVVNVSEDASPTPKPRILQTPKSIVHRQFVTRENNLFENMAKPSMFKTSVIVSSKSNTVNTVSATLPTVSTSVITKLTNIVSTTQQPKPPGAISKLPVVRTTSPIVQSNLRIESVNKAQATVQYVVPAGGTSLITHQNGPTIRTLVNPVLNNTNSAVTRALLSSKVARPVTPRVQVPQIRNQTFAIRSPASVVQTATTSVPVVNQQVTLRGPSGLPLRGPIQLLIPGTGKTILVNPSQIISSQNKLIAPAVTSGIRTTTQRVNVPVVQSVKQITPSSPRDPILSQPWTSQNFIIRTQRPATIAVSKAEPIVIPASVAVPINNSTILVKTQETQQVRPDNTVPILEKMALQLSQGTASIHMDTLNQNNNHQ